MGETPKSRTVHIDIGRDFSRILGARFRKDGPYSGEEFREDILEPAFVSCDRVVIALDSLSGFSASFFEEAFGGLVRKYGLAAVRSKIEFRAVERRYIVPKITTWMEEAGKHADL